MPQVSEKAFKIRNINNESDLYSTATTAFHKN